MMRLVAARICLDCCNARSLVEMGQERLVTGICLMSGLGPTAEVIATCRTVDRYHKGLTDCSKSAAFNSRSEPVERAGNAARLLAASPNCTSPPPISTPREVKKQEASISSREAQRSAPHRQQMEAERCATANTSDLHYIFSHSLTLE
jgi:hypothetical protein